jgi:hypothetical protein
MRRKFRKRLESVEYEVAMERWRFSVSVINIQGPGRFSTAALILAKSWEAFHLEQMGQRREPQRKGWTFRVVPRLSLNKNHVLPARQRRTDLGVEGSRRTRATSA